MTEHEAMVKRGRLVGFGLAAALLGVAQIAADVAGYATNRGIASRVVRVDRELCEQVAIDRAIEPLLRPGVLKTRVEQFLADVDKHNKKCHPPPIIPPPHSPSPRPVPTRTPSASPGTEGTRRSSTTTTVVKRGGRTVVRRRVVRRPSPTVTATRTRTARPSPSPSPSCLPGLPVCLRRGAPALDVPDRVGSARSDTRRRSASWRRSRRSPSTYQVTMVTARATIT